LRDILLSAGGKSLPEMESLCPRFFLPEFSDFKSGKEFAVRQRKRLVDRRERAQISPDDAAQAVRG